MQLGDRIKARRKQLRMTSSELASKAEVTRYTISRYENNNIDMNTFHLCKIAEALKTTPDFLLGFNDLEVSNLIYAMRHLDAQGQQDVIKYTTQRFREYVSSLTAPSKAVLNSQQAHTIRLYGYVSAGTGQTMQDDNTDTVTVMGPIPQHDFAVKVIGDSMEPLFDNNQIIFVNRLKDNYEIRSGQFVIVELNGEAYIKKIKLNGKQIILVSLNKKYKNIIINDWDDFKIKGLVII